MINKGILVSLEDRAKMIKAAMAEVGIFVEVYEKNGLLWYIPAEESEESWEHFHHPDNRLTLIKAWCKASVLCGGTARCVPCSDYAFRRNWFLADHTLPRISPDCDGTGRCADG